MTLPVIAAQVASLNSSRVFSAFRPWRGRDASPGQAAPQGHHAAAAHADSEDVVHPAMRRGSVSSSSTTTTSLSSSSLSPSPSSSSTRPDRRSRARMLVAAPAPALSVSTSAPASASPSYLYAYSSGSPHASSSWPGPAGGVHGSSHARSSSGTPASSSSSSATGDDTDARPRAPAADEAAPPAPADTKFVTTTSISPSPSPPPPPSTAETAPPPPPPTTLATHPPSLKRRRALSDVDGPDTGVLCYKKRRLRRFLITSRLSQPFSQPASHILNRESVASGDKRFLKLAALMNARRIRSPQALAGSPISGAPPATEAVWRAAMANRFRKRLFAEAAAATNTGGRPIVGSSAPVQLMNSARLTMVPIAAAATAASMAAVRIVSSSSGSGSGSGSQAICPKLPLAVAVKAAAAAAAAAAVPPAVGSQPATRPVSPRLRAVRDTTTTKEQVQQDYPRPSLDDINDDDDEAGCAFPTSQHGSRYGVDEYDDEDGRPDDDDVYADFSVLFSSSSGGGGGGDDADWGGSSEEGLDDYMDELDGIAHLPR